MEAFDPIHLEVIDESHEHKAVKGAQSHFRAIIVSPHFVGKTRLERHKKVYRALLVELDGLIKAFSVLTYEPRQWKGKECSLPQAPALGNLSHGVESSSRLAE